MAAPRFYVEVETEALDKALAEQAEVVLPPKAAHHAGRALRLRTGEETVVFNLSLIHISEPTRPY